MRNRLNYKYSYLRQTCFGIIIVRQDNPGALSSYQIIHVLNIKDRLRNTIRTLNQEKCRRFQMAYTLKHNLNQKIMYILYRIVLASCFAFYFKVLATSVIDWLIDWLLFFVLLENLARQRKLGPLILRYHSKDCSLQSPSSMDTVTILYWYFYSDHHL